MSALGSAIELARRASSIFSTAAFRRLLANGRDVHIDASLSLIGDELAIDRLQPRRKVVDAAYELLKSNYRSEYYYKNTIATKLFVGKHRASRSVALLNELRVGNSVADYVLLNGNATVFEIKTEYDSPSKLRTQIADYYQAFRLVNIVTHSTHVEKYCELLANSPVGVLAIGPRGHLSYVKEPTEAYGSLSTRSMFNLLRLGEITRLLELHYGHVPQLPNCVRYSEYLALAEQIPLASFQIMVESALKKRGIRHSRDAMLDESLAPLRSIIAALDPPQHQQRVLKTWLSESLG